MSSATKGPDGTRLVSLSDEEAVKRHPGWDGSRSLEGRQQSHAAWPSKRERYRVAIDRRAQPGTFVYDEVKRAAAAFASLGCDIVTGGGLGLMQAANEGAKSGARRDRSAFASNCPSSRT